MSPWLVLIVLIVVWGLPIVAGCYLGKRKGRTATGVWLTVILGVLGLAILAFVLRRSQAKKAAAAPLADDLQAVGSIQPPWAGLSETDSWVWR